MEFQFEHNKRKLVASLNPAPFAAGVFVDEENGQPYADVSTRIVQNPLLDAVWVKKGDIQEVLADKIGFMVKTSVETQAGFNTYIKYDLNLNF